MNLSKFLQLGLVTVIAASSFSSAMAKPLDTALQNPVLNNTEIVQIIKANISSEDLTYVVVNDHAEDHGKSQKIYDKINHLISSKFGNSNLNAVHHELDNTLKQLGADNSHVKVSYSYAVPQEIIDEVAKTNPNVTKNDSSRADGSFDVSRECDIKINLAVDNKGRLFESSELSGLTKEQVSKMTNEEIMSVLKETVLHEASHCALKKDFQETNFALNFSKSYSDANPAIAKQLNSKIKEVSDKIAANDMKNINILNYMTFINYHENFADVNGAFARLGEHPDAQSIKEAKEQLLNVARLRENTGLTHKTQFAVQYALEKIDLAATMNPQERTQFAKQIASDSLMNNMRLVLKAGVGSANSNTFANYMVDGLKIEKDGSLEVNIAPENVAQHGKIQKEILTMRDAKPILGTMSQEIKSYDELLAQYQKNNAESLTRNSVTTNANTTNSTIPNSTIPTSTTVQSPSNKYKFNVNAVHSMREKAFSSNHTTTPTHKL